MEFEDEKFKQFQFCQVDKIETIVKRMRLYIQQLTTNKVASLQLTEGKKEKNKGKREKKQNEGGKKKRVKKIESDEEVEDGKPSVFLIFLLCRRQVRL